ncbi:hypothetical protein B0H14DRAFT_2652938 [Mycena olivaceomarginata]|nr:hypothetical protein B0H14DRAFT_2652938 [Mycena olivaceomarginata]
MVESTRHSNAALLADARASLRYQTKVNGDPHSDGSSTSNLKKHAKHCWGSNVVEARLKGVAADATRDGSIFCSICSVWTTPRQSRVSFVGSQSQIGRSKSFKTASLKTSLPLEYDGRLSFATDAGTSPNHRAFVAWTVHLQHKGDPWSFFWISSKSLSYTQVKSSHNTALDRSSENDFDAANRVRCLNHTMNLAVKVFLCPFQPRPPRKDASGNLIEGDDNADLEELILNLDLDEDVNDNDSMPDLEDASCIASIDVTSVAFDDHKQAEMLRETKEAKTAISRISRPL